LKVLLKRLTLGVLHACVSEWLARSHYPTLGIVSQSALVDHVNVGHVSYCDVKESLRQQACPGSDHHHCQHRKVGFVLMF